MPLQRYVCHKEVRAAQISVVDRMPMLSELTKDGPGATLHLEDGERRVVTVKYVRKHDPQPGGYFVLYADGYESFSPAGAFEAGHSLIEGA